MKSPLCLAALVVTASCMPTNQTPLQSGHAAWHAARIASLTSEDGWLTLVGLDFLTDGSITIGGGDRADLRYPNCAAPIVGRLDVSGSTVRFTPDGASEASTLTADDAGAPSVIRSGSVSFTLVRRNDRLALRVRDNLSPVRTGFAGIACFPIDERVVVAARVLRPAPDERVAITNVRGFVESQPVAAVLDFELLGRASRLVATAGSNGRLFVVFGDETNGVSTYGGGRFLDLDAPRDGTVIIDFNRAYNPPCAFTAYATCPIPPACNRLSTAVSAGECLPHPGDSPGLH